MDYILEFKNALAYMEGILPPLFGPKAQQIVNLESVTTTRRDLISPHYAVQAVNQFLASSPDLDTSDHVEAHPLPTAPVVEDDEPDSGESYDCDGDIQEALREFHQKIHKLWPVDCQVPHKLMLKLVPRRQYRETKELELDTLSSWHDQRWGRIVYVMRYVIGHLPSHQ